MILLLAALILLVPGAAWAEEAVQIPGVIHVHTTRSTGSYSLDELIRRARADGIRALVLTENYLQRFEYGLYPFRGLLRVTEEFPSLRPDGVRAYLLDVAEAARRHPDMILVPGLEVLPHYYWTGSPFEGTLTMWNGQKNMLVAGLPRPEDYEGLPISGNAGAARLSWGSGLLLLPGLLWIPGIYLWRVRRKRRVRLRHFTVVREVASRPYGALLMAAGAIGLANNFPFTIPPADPYRADPGVAPHQRLIDYVRERGGVIFWSMPEARDQQAHRRGRFTITIRTDPYPDDLLRTTGYTGFGAVYEDTTTVERPGQQWDRVLLAYQAGQRREPAWAMGEAAYHREGHAGKHVATILTWFQASRPSADGVLQAMRGGRMVAAKRTAAYALRLDEFAILAAGPGAPAAMGGTARVPPGAALQVRVAIAATDGRAHGVEADLIRSGRVVRSWRGETPFQATFADALGPAGARAYYRLQVRGEGGHQQLLANPIFVEAGES